MVIVCCLLFFFLCFPLYLSVDFKRNWRLEEDSSGKALHGCQTVKIILLHQIRLSPTTQLKHKIGRSQCFGYQKHAPTDDPNKGHILHSSRTEIQISVLSERRRKSLEPDLEGAARGGDRGGSHGAPSRQQQSRLKGSNG